MPLAYCLCSFRNMLRLVITKSGSTLNWILPNVSANKAYILQKMQECQLLVLRWNSKALSNYHPTGLHKYVHIARMIWLYVRWLYQCTFCGKALARSMSQRLYLISDLETAQNVKYFFLIYMYVRRISELSIWMSV